jgi:hypothetical protein
MKVCLDHTFGRGATDREWTKEFARVRSQQGSRRTFHWYVHTLILDIDQLFMVLCWLMVWRWMNLVL